MRTQKLKWLDRLLAGILERLARRAVVNHRFPKSILIIKLSAMGDGLCLITFYKEPCDGITRGASRLVNHSPHKSAVIREGIIYSRDNPPSYDWVSTAQFLV